MNHFDLVELAEKYKSEAGVAVLLLSINELRGRVVDHLNRLEMNVKMGAQQLFNPAVSIPLSSTDIVTVAAKYAATMDALHRDYFNLATLLQKIAPHEQIEF